MDKIKLTIQEEKELIYDAIEKQVCELNEYPYIYSVITFGFYNNNGDRLPPDTIRKFWDKYEVERTCRLIYNLIKENLKTLQIYSFIERHEELLDGNGEHIKDGRFHINLISTDINDYTIEEPDRKVKRLMNENNGYGIPISSMVGDIDTIKISLLEAAIKRADFVNKFQYSIKTQWLNTEDDLKRTIRYCFKDYLIHNKVDFSDIIVSKASDFCKP